MSDHVDYLIIGGGVAGTTAAEAIRARDAQGSIAIVSEEPHRLYSRILLSKPTFFLERIPFENIWLKKEEWYTEKNIQLIAGTEANKLDVHAKTVSLDNGRSISYNKLLLAIGGCARQWEMPGAEKKGIYYLRTLDDGKAVIEGVKHAKNAVCVGSGFISFEMCEMLRMAGISVTLLMREPYYWSPLLDETAGKMIEQALEIGGVTLKRGAEVATIEGNDAVTSVTLKDGTKLATDMVLVGIGVMCPFAWLSAGGVAVNRAILTNEFLETNIPDVWAAGDAAEFKDVILDEQLQLGNWVNAQMQGRVVGANMAGEKKPFRMVSFYTAQAFDTRIGFVGDVRALPDRQSVGRKWPDANSYIRFILSKGRVLGATLINRTQDLGVISKLIESTADISKYTGELADSTVDLKVILDSVTPKNNPA